MNEDRQEFARNIVRSISRLERLRRRYMNEHLEAYKLKGTMFQIILYLDRNPGSSQDALVDDLSVDKSGIARKCRQLDDCGYIKREQYQENRRQNRLFLTSSGQDLLPIIRSLLSEWREIVTQSIGTADQHLLIHLLETMMNNAEKTIHSSPR